MGIDILPILKRLVGANHPVVTQQERAIRRAMKFVFILIIVFAGVMLYGLVTTGRVQWIIMIAPMWLSTMTLVFLAARLANAHHDARRIVDRGEVRLCPSCQYDLAELPEEGICPECGKAYCPSEIRERWLKIYEALEKKPGPWT